MCGIVGYNGQRQAMDILISGLKRLEYRGYDSAGIAIFNGENIAVTKAKGRLVNLEGRLKDAPLTGSIGIGHTRWATHGEPSDINSHPHTDVKGEIAIVHNGIIENYLPLKEMLQGKGCVFVSETDTEVVAHLLNYYYEGDMLATIYKVLPMLKGSFALGILCKSQPEKLFAVRKDSPLVVGHTDHGCFMASDIPAILEYCRDVYLLDDLDVAVLGKDGLEILDAFGNQLNREPLHVDWNIKTAEKGGYEHFMIKEIHEEPLSLKDTLTPHVTAGGDLDADSMPVDAETVQKIEHITVLACGTAYHAGLVGKALIEKICRIPVDAEVASEFRYRDPIIQPNTLFIVVSQSGETADTIAALREAQSQGCKVLAITNVVGSTVSREADYVIYTWAGPEIAVASTKAYISQLMVFYILTLDFALKRGRLDAAQAHGLIGELMALPSKAKDLLDQKNRIQRFAHTHYDHHSVFYLGRGLDYALAQEASLKLKEISYIHSEAYAAGELKHGTIALIEPGTLVVALVTQRQLMEKTISNIKEVKVRGAEVLALCTPDTADEVEKEVDVVWRIPGVPADLAPVLAIVPMQMLAYYMALEKGCDIDKPRNLAKSVTVE